MDITWARNMYKTMSIYDMPMTVVHYDRVSSDTMEQLNSLANQNLFNEEMIKNNPNWTYGGKYVDEGISGVSTTKREDFQRLIEDAKQGKFDFVITKEISRFARNILDSIRYTRELLSYGVCVFFQNDNINTIEEDSEFRLSIMASVAQEESRKLSSRVKYGHSVSIKNGVILGHDIYGYTKKDKKTLVHDDRYKPMIEFIFEKYASEELSTNKLSDVLYEMGYRSFKGGKITSTVIKHIIVNPKYKGYYCGKKVQVVNMFTKEQKFLDKEEWIMYKDYESIPPIVSEELWGKANAVYKKRSAIVKNRNTSLNNMENKFTGKIICYNDGHPYWLKSNKSRNKKIPGNNPSWKCSHKQKDSKGCSSMTIYESELIPIILDLVKNTIFTKDLIQEYASIYKSVANSEDYEKQIEILESEIERINLKKDKILDYNLDGKISDEEYTKRNDAFNEELKIKNSQIIECRNKLGNSDNIDKVLKDIGRVFNEMRNIEFTEVNSRMIDNLFDKIIAKPIAEKHMELIFVLKNGDCCSTQYPAKKGEPILWESGYMVKTISPKCHKDFTRQKNWSEATKYKVSYTYSLALATF